MGRLVRTISKALERGEVIINLAEDEKILQETDPVKLKDNLKRKTAYIMHRERAGLTAAAWCRTLCIPKERDSNFCTGAKPVPNSILNRAACVSKKVNALTKRLQSRFMNG